MIVIIVGVDVGGVGVGSVHHGGNGTHNNKFEKERRERKKVIEVYFV
jgi:hypothetical protein